ncbi:polysaccharide deacetylase family protein [Niabella pedocola]|uniref:Polysaccharide deacetylase family protein n=1 Tax=Niabella pedocola TaxID=1752077 RepID=A0ABS8PM17_9BACT|nr:polysaccharide deacetylase family protein [Niabella pedocola]MCD2422145.1 polysaccharide deacetylase family protein [Niabella pedocola]
MKRVKQLKVGIPLYCSFVLIFLYPRGAHEIKDIAPAVQDRGWTVRLTGLMDPDVTASNSSFYQPPVLCYHQVRNRLPSDTKHDRSYIVSLTTFHEHMKMLKDSGYHTILPDQWIAFLKRGVLLPKKCFILTFDDGTRGQFENALPELDRYGFKAVFFIMTVSVDKSRYMTGTQLRHLADEGHVIGCHTWDHHDVRFYKQADWFVQLVQPTQQLERLTGSRIRYFAYPFGSWNKAAIQQLINDDYELAFQLYGPVNPEAPAFTVRRILVDGSWNTNQLERAIGLFNSNNR